MDLPLRNPYPHRQNQLDEKAGANTMTEQTPQRKGRDFAIGFFVGLIPLILGIILLLGILEGTDPFYFNLLAAGTILALIGVFWRRHLFVGIGMLTALVATPLLLLGSCFALSSFF
jgi:hypothetical protein